jgi:fluoride exporter
MLRELYLAALVFVGAGLGGTMRHAANKLVMLATPTPFPIATLAVNVVGCFAMGLLAGWFMLKGETGGQTLRLLLTTGFLGGFTTFSAFSLDAALLWERGSMVGLAAYVGCSVLGSLLAVFAGLALVRSALA